MSTENPNSNSEKIFSSEGVSPKTFVTSRMPLPTGTETGAGRKLVKFLDDLFVRDTAEGLREILETWLTTEPPAPAKFEIPKGATACMPLPVSDLTLKSKLKGLLRDIFARDIVETIEEIRAIYFTGEKDEIK